MKRKRRCEKDVRLVPPPFKDDDSPRSSPFKGEVRRGMGYSVAADSDVGWNSSQEVRPRTVDGRAVRAGAEGGNTTRGHGTMADLLMDKEPRAC